MLPTNRMKAQMVTRIPLPNVGASVARSAVIRPPPAD